MAPETFYRVELLNPQPRACLILRSFVGRLLKRPSLGVSVIAAPIADRIVMPLFAREMMLVRDDLDPDEMKKPGGGRTKSHDSRALLTFIADTTEDNPISVCQWAELAGIKRETLRDYLPLLRSRGWIQTVGEGTKARQHITEDGKKAAA